MANSPYRISGKDKWYVIDYLRRKLALESFYPSEATWFEAERDFREARRTIETLNAWADQYLSDKQWEQLKQAVRQRRKRSRGEQLRRATLTPPAHRMLRAIAKRDNVTLSEVIERYLDEEYQKWLDEEFGDD